MWALWVLSSCSHCFPPPHISTSSLHHIDKALNCRILDPEVLLLLFIHQSCLTLLQPARLLCPWDFPGKNTGVGCHFLLQEVFPTQGSNPSLLHLYTDSLPLSQQRLPRLFIYQAVPGLSCSPRICSCACGVQFPDQGLNPGLLRWECGVLATGPLWKSCENVSLSDVSYSL